MQQLDLFTDTLKAEVISTPGGLILRDYQAEAVENAFRLWNAGSVGCIVRIPTGAGKTLTATTIGIRWNAQGLEYRTIVFCHEKQLIGQFADEIEDITGNKPGVEQGEKRILQWDINDTSSNGGFYVVSKMSLWSREVKDYQGETYIQQPRLEKFNPNKFKWLVVIDELHRYQASQKSFKHIIEWFRRSPHCKTLGVTATPERGDKKTLAKLTPDIAIDYRLYDIDGGPSAVNDGYVVGYDQRFVVVEGVDFGKIKEKCKDFDEKELEDELSTTKALASMIEPTIRLVEDRSTLIFCVTIAMAKKVAGYINALRDKILSEGKEAHGNAETLDGTIPDVIRTDCYERHQAGKFQFLVVCALCREGYNDPNIGAVAIYRPTKSRPLAEQMKGRGCRTLRGTIKSGMTREERLAAIAASRKPACMIVDLVGVTGMADCASTAHLLASGKCDEVVNSANANAMKKINADPDASIDMAEELKQAERKIKAREDAKAEKARKRKEKEDEEERKRSAARASLEANVHYRAEKVNQGHGSGATRVEPGEKLIDFGKHKGTTMSKVPIGYLKWVAETDMPWFRKGPCLAELKRRGITMPKKKPISSLGCTCHMGHPPCSFCTSYERDEREAIMSEASELPF